MTAPTWTPWRRVQAAAKQEAIRKAFAGFLALARASAQLQPWPDDPWIMAKLSRRAERDARRWATRRTAAQFNLTPERVTQVVGRPS